jgi:hypothetical protein
MDLRQSCLDELWHGPDSEHCSRSVSALKRAVAGDDLAVEQYELAGRMSSDSFGDAAVTAAESPPSAPTSTTAAHSASCRSGRLRSGGMSAGFCDLEEPALRSGSSSATFKAGGDRTMVASTFEIRRPPAANRGKALLYPKQCRRDHWPRRQTPPRCSVRAPSTRPGQGHGRRRTRQSVGGRAPR